MNFKDIREEAFEMKPLEFANFLDSSGAFITARDIKSWEEGESSPNMDQLGLIRKALPLSPRFLLDKAFRQPKKVVPRKKKEQTESFETNREMATV